MLAKWHFTTGYTKFKVGPCPYLAYTWLLPWVQMFYSLSIVRSRRRWIYLSIFINYMNAGTQLPCYWEKPSKHGCIYFDML